MKPTPPQFTYSVFNLLTYWAIWMVGNIATIFLNIYLHTYLAFIYWCLMVFVAQGYLFSKISQAKDAIRVQLLWQLLIVAGAVVSVLEGIFLFWFLEGCFFAAGCFWTNL